jgi:hypothetical protein
MPFKSKQQLRTCYARQLSAKAKGKSSSWDCKEWLKETPVSGTCLPEKIGESTSRCQRKNEKVVSPVYEGKRGGLYFYVSGVKVYVPRDAQSYVRKKYKIKKE